MRKTAVLLTGCLLVVLSGCSSTRIAYNYADQGIIWWVEDYVTLTSAQEEQLEQDLASLQQWHCSDELPRYSTWLRELETDILSGTPDVETIRYHQQQLLGFVPQLLERGTPAAQNLLESLSDEQVRELADNMASKQKELEEEMLAGSPEETARARAERTRERIEGWLGDLNEQQWALVQAWSADRAQQTQIWLEGRRNWQNALLAELDHRKQPGFDDAVRDLLVHSEQARGEAYRRMSEESRQAMAVLIHDLIQAGGPEHREHILAKARDLNSDFVALTCQ